MATVKMLPPSARWGSNSDGVATSRNGIADPSNAKWEGDGVSREESELSTPASSPEGVPSLMHRSRGQSLVQHKGRRWSRTPPNTAVVEALVKGLDKTEEDLEGEDDDDLVGETSYRNSGSVEVPDQEILSHSGFLSKKTGAFSGHKRRFFVLQQGTLLWYKSEKDSRATGFVHLRDCQISTAAASNMKAATFTFSIKTTGRKEYVFHSDDEDECNTWVRVLRHNASLKAPPIAKLAGTEAEDEEIDSELSSKAARLSTASDEGEAQRNAAGGDKAKKKDVKRSIVGSLALRVEKRMVGRAVTSDLGKKLLREFCLPETFTMLQALRELASSDTALPSRAGQTIENTILKIAVKVALLHQHKRLAPADFNPMVALVDDLCIDLVRKYDATKPLDPERTMFRTDRCDPEHSDIHKQMAMLQAELVKVLQDHISPKNIKALCFVTTYFGDGTNLKRFCGETVFAKNLGLIADSLRKMYNLKDYTGY